MNVCKRNIFNIMCWPTFFPFITTTMRRRKKERREKLISSIPLPHFFPDQPQYASVSTSISEMMMKKETTTVISYSCSTKEHRWIIYTTRGVVWSDCLNVHMIVGGKMSREREKAIKSNENSILTFHNFEWRNFKPAPM